VKAKDDERALATKKKAEDARKRKEIKDENKRKALVNRQNMETQKTQKLSTHLDTQLKLAQYNETLTLNNLEALQLLLDGLDSASERLEEPPVDPDFPADTEL
jgi:hypothetical protein